MYVFVENSKKSRTPYFVYVKPHLLIVINLNIGGHFENMQIRIIYGLVT